ncbi:MAG: DNA repair protein RecN, partial [Chthoniobacterales bacterium]|nr:DNA repair protein RecN [Chthoniobacterales bacterium]
MLATLASLRIRNLALVEDLTWEPGAGLVAITGETGAGKSLLIGALQLLLGERADKSLIRAGADSCTVEAVFEVTAGAGLDEWLEEQGAEPCADDGLLVKRTLSAAGSGRQFINGSACTLSALKGLGDRLVDLHGPHDHQSLFSREAQTRVLDAFAGQTELASAFATAHREQARLCREIERLQAMESDAAMRREMLAHTVQEIESAALHAGEEEDLLARLRTAGNSRRLLELSAQIGTALEGDSEGGVRDSLAEAIRAGRELARLDPGATALSDALEAVSERLSDIESDARRYAEAIECDPQKLAGMEQRADLLQSLKRKYGGSLEQVMERGVTAARELQEIETRGEAGVALEKERAAAGARATKLAAKLSAARVKAAPAFAAAVTAELR